MKTKIIALLGALLSICCTTLKYTAPFIPAAGVAQNFMFGTNTSDNSAGIWESNSPGNIHGNRRYQMIITSQEQHFRGRKTFWDTLAGKDFTITNAAFLWADATTGQMKVSGMPSLFSMLSNSLTLPYANITGVPATSETTITVQGAMSSTVGVNAYTLSVPVQTTGIVSNIIPTLTAMSGMSITTSGESYSLTNTSPDKTVTISSTNLNVISAYPSFTLSAPSRTYNTTPGRSLSTTGTNNTFVISSTNDTRVNYTINFSIALTLLPPLTSNGFVGLDYSIDGGATWIPVSSVSEAYGVAVTLTKNSDFNLPGEIPAGARVRIYRSINTNCTITIGRQQEVNY